MAGMNNNERIMGLDFGSKTVGVAISDPFGWTAQGIETIVRKQSNKLRKTYARIEELIAEYDVKHIVLGLPLNMDDTEGERCVATREFMADLIRRTGLPVTLWDERLTTMEAEEVLAEGGVAKKDRKQHLDRMAAQLILQSYLNAEEYKNGKNQF